MKIVNLEKFRKDMYNAIEDSMMWAWDITECSSILSKEGGSFVDGTPYARTLAYPLKIRVNDKLLYITIDDEGASIFEEDEKRFLWRADVDPYFTETPASFAMLLMFKIMRILTERPYTEA